MVMKFEIHTLGNTSFHFVQLESRYMFPSRRSSSFPPPPPPPPPPPQAAAQAACSGSAAPGQRRGGVAAWRRGCAWAACSGSARPGRRRGGEAARRRRGGGVAARRRGGGDPPPPSCVRRSRRGVGRVVPAARTPRGCGSQPTTRQDRPADVKGGRQRLGDERGHAHGETSAGIDAQ